MYYTLAAYVFTTIPKNVHFLEKKCRGVVSSRLRSDILFFRSFNFVTLRKFSLLQLFVPANTYFRPPNVRNSPRILSHALWPAANA